MARYKGDGKDQDRRKGASGNRINGVPRVEALEERRLLDGNASVTPLFTPTNGNQADTVNGPLANLGTKLVTVYQEFKGAGFPVQFRSSLAEVVQIKGNRVGIDVKINGDMKAGLTALTNLGFTVGALDTVTNVAEGTIPIANLPTLARTPQVLAVAPILRPKLATQGIAPNQADTSMLVATARTQFGLTGAGVKIGVLSDSVNLVTNPNGLVGLAGSVQTGDLPSNVTVLEDLAAGDGGTDEGRAMLEEIYDLAPGAQLFFATAFTGPVGFANNIRALAAAGAQVIVDDVGYGSQPFFQDGVISQAVSDVRNQYNVLYFSAAGNSADQGYESAFRATNTTVGSLGSGTYMDFDPGPGVTTQLPVTVTAGGAIDFQYDQPFYTTSGVTSNVDFFLLNADGSVAASGTDNNVATQTPDEFVANIPAGSYTAVIKVISGPSIGRVRFSNFSRSDVTVSHQFGTAGDTSYPATSGQSTSADGIGVGAVPWFNLAPDYATNRNESFSSFGPANFLFDATGNRLSSIQRRQKPDISATDGINTSFFGGQFTPGVVPGNVDTLYNFFGTSAAAPNAAAVAALMKQLNPGVTIDQARAAFAATATPLNGQAQGSWTPQAGFGFINASAALAQVDQLRVSSTTPANNSTVTTAPTSITIKFSKNVNPATLDASDLIVTSLPSGVTVTVGTPFFPVAGDATQVSFPLTYARAGATANGNYAFSLADNSIVAADGKGLVAYSLRYTLADTIAPKVVNTQIVGRLILVQFSEALDPNTVTPYNIGFASRGTGSFTTNLALAPGAKFTSNAATGLVTIDLSALPQLSLPTDLYAIVVTSAVKDVVGNTLDGEFFGTFPSGNNVAGGTFIQYIGPLALTPPVIVNLTLATDSGIPSDGNTGDVRPTFVGQVATTFPGTVAGLRVLIQFNGLNGGQPITLGLGANNRGYIGSFDMETTTDANGLFSFRAPSALADGYNQVRVVVIAGQDNPNAAGYSSYQDNSFRIDSASPTTSINPTTPLLVNGIPTSGGALIGSLTTMSLTVQDPNVGTGLLVPTQLSFPALDPSRVSNVSNYQLFLYDPATGAAVDYSSVITGAVFVPTTNRANPTVPYTGRIDLTFNSGSLPAGLYVFKIKQYDPATGVGMTDAAGNSFDGDPMSPGIQDFVLTLNIQTQPVYLNSFYAISTDGTVQGPKAYFEQTGGTPNGAAAPPSQFILDFSNPLNGASLSANSIQVFGSRDSANTAPDGDFGNFGITTDVNGNVNTGGEFTRVGGVQIILDHVVATSTSFGQPGYASRLRVILPSGLAPDNYRIYMPNAGASALKDAFGNTFDGEFLGTQSDTNNPLLYDTLQPNGLYRPGITGDSRPGGAFVTGFTIVPHGNVVFVNPDAIDNPFDSSDDPTGSAARPYSTLAPEGPNNNASNFGTGFNTGLDRNGNGHFDRSAFIAARDLVTANGGPVIVLAQRGSLVTDAISGQNIRRPYVIQAPSGSDPILNDGSASVPAMTTLVMTTGTTVKMQNASLLVQQNGAALQLQGSQLGTDRVTFTSYADDTISGDTNRDGSSSAPQGGDWGGIVFRKYNNSGRNTSFTVDGVLPSTAGADDVMSSLVFANLLYGGGTVPQTVGTRYDTVTLFNSRPTMTNLNINFSGQTVGTQAPISGDLNSFREDDISRGPLIRRVSLQGNTLNAILVRPEINGLISPSNAINYAADARDRGVQRTYVFDESLPLAFLATVQLGNYFLEASGGQSGSLNARINVQPGSLLKFTRGAGIEIASGSQINIGDRNYIDQYDVNANFAATDTGFRAAEVGSAKAVLTSLFDDVATTYYVDNNIIDPATGQPLRRTIVAPLDSDGGGTALQPSPGSVQYAARWGGITVLDGAILVTDEAQYYYGGGAFNTPDSTDVLRPVIFLASQRFFGGGSRVMITNNDFFDNSDAGIGATPNALAAGDPLRPLVSAHPFFRGNVMQRNTYNGMRIYGIRAITGTDNTTTIVELVPLNGSVNQTVSSVWDATDLTYILKGTLQFEDNVNLTLQSAVPGTLLANGEIIGKPGESLVVKLLNDYAPAGNGVSGSTSSVVGGAGFIVGVDNGIDPDADSLIDPGVDASIRILGVPANETTGQSRVPVIITSLRDNSIARTVRGVDQSVSAPSFTGAAAAGDGGIIFVGGLAKTSGNLYDPTSGTVIDNADIRYMTRIEFQGGGLIRNAIDTGPPTTDGSPIVPDGSYTNADDLRGQLNGISPITGNFDPTLASQSTLAVRIATTNLSNFSQTGVLAHPGFNLLANNPALNPGPTDPAFIRTGVRGRPVDLYLVNNTLNTMPIGVRVVSETTVGPFGQFSTTADSQQQPFYVALLNNTFYNTDTGLQTAGQPLQVGTSFNLYSSVRWLALNNIFSNNRTEAITSVGMIIDSDAQYNLFFQNGSNLSYTNRGVDGSFPTNAGASFSDPKFRDPANGDFRLQPGSGAIDASRSELGPNFFGNMLQPIFDANGNRTNGRQMASSSGFGGFFSSSDIVSLPGYTLTSYSRVAIPVAPTYIPNSSAPNPSTYSYVLIAGERDQAGFLRQDDGGTPNSGFGSRPFFDIGAFEYRRLFPPHVVSFQTVTGSGQNVQATKPDGTTVDLYSVGSVAGINVNPSVIRFAFDRNLDPTTINNLTVLLQASGGDGIFGNGNSPLDTFIDLSGKVTLDPLNPRILIINVGAAGLALASDEYRIQLKGTGQSVIRDSSGNALDGENIDANGNQIALPSGDGFPGGTFQLTFTVDTTSPSFIPGSVILDPASDTNIVGDLITADNTPSFVGQITDVFPPTNPLQNQTVYLEYYNAPAGGYQLVGTSQTDANGNFNVTTSNPFPDSPYNVGNDGILGTSDDSGASAVRITAQDTSGNLSTSVVTGFVIDTVGPDITGLTPAPNTQAPLVGGSVNFSLTFNENVDLSTFNTNTVQLVGSGGDGIFGNGNDQIIPLNAASIAGVYYAAGNTLHTTQGQMTVNFSFSGFTRNDQYQLTIRGSGTNRVTDIAGNAILGGTDLTTGIVVYSPALSKSYFVGGLGYVIDPTASQGSRTNPFQSINAAITAAGAGDIVAVLPGVYGEAVTLKSLVTVMSVDPSSSAGNYIPGNAQETVIRAPLSSADAAGIVTSVTATNIISTSGLVTTFQGFTVATPLLGNPATGIQSGDSIGLSVTNSDMLITKNYFVNSGFGIKVTEAGANAATPLVQDNGIVGNGIGLSIIDAGGGTSLTRPIQVANNTVTFNTVGIQVGALGSSPVLAQTVNNIFWQNRDLGTTHPGAAISANFAGKITSNNNLFSNNGPNLTSPADDTVNVTNGFNPAILTATPDSLGNFTGAPAFVAPRDPRPSADGPGVFFLDGNFDLQLSSAAIDAALGNQAPANDFRSRGRVRITGRGFPGTGPADVGAFEYNGTGGIAAGATFRVVSTSLADSGAAKANNRMISGNGLNAVVVTFSGFPDAASIVPADLVLAGDAVDPANPARATSLTWLNAYTVQFNLNGNLRQNGTLIASINGAAVTDSMNGRGNVAFSDAVQISTPVLAPVVAPATPPAAAAPVAPAPGRTPVKVSPAAARAAANAKAAAARAAKAAAAKAAAAQRVALRQAAVPKGPARAFRS
ncbi:Ig-like domain-containing protein [Isosphaeraceae bacterium EP7]